jgi:hypothetical protein
VRILPFIDPPAGDLPLALDTGSDSLFLMASPPAGSLATASSPRPVEPPATYEVHRHPDVDEYIVLHGNAGFLLNGPSLASVTRTPFRAPCLIVMPAGGFHRIATTEEQPAADPALLAYTDRRATVEPFASIMGRTSVATLDVDERRTAR